MLDDLEARLPGLLANCKQEDMLDCFAKEADAIDAQTKEEDHAHVWGRLQQAVLACFQMTKNAPMNEAVEAQWDADDQTLQGLAWKLAPPIPNTKHDDGVSGVLFG